MNNFVSTGGYSPPCHQLRVRGREYGAAPPARWLRRRGRRRRPHGRAPRRHGLLPPPARNPHQHVLQAGVPRAVLHHQQAVGPVRARALEKGTFLRLPVAL